MKKFPVISALLTLMAGCLHASQPSGGERITDITPRGFSVVWNSASPAAADLRVFSDAAGTIPVANAVVAPHPTANGSETVREAAEAIGVLKVGVSNLAADTTYHIRTVTTSNADFTSIFGPLRPVRTAKQPLRARAAAGLTPLANPLLKFDLYLPDGVTPAAGALLMVEVPGAVSPVSAFVGGDGLAAPVAIVDLNNLYAVGDGETLRINGGEAVNLILEMGVHGRESLPFFLPHGDSFAKVCDPQLVATPGAPPALMVRRNSTGVAQVFLDFPVKPGRIYQVQQSNTLEALSWTPIPPAVPAEASRLFLYDNGSPAAATGLSNVPVRFYRLHDLTPPE